MSEKLSPLNIIWGSFILFRRYCRTFAYSLGLPLIVIIVLSAIFVQPQNPSFALVLFLFIFKLLFIILTAHVVFRLILLKEKTHSFISVLILNKSKIELIKTYFFIYARIFLLFFLLNFVVVLIYPDFIPNEDAPIDHNQLEKVNDLARYLFLPCGYLLARYVLALPASALAIKMSLSQSFAMTKSHHIPLFIIVGVFPWLLYSVLYKLHSPDLSTVSIILLQFLQVIFNIIQAICIALCFEKIVPSALLEKTTPPNTPPLTESNSNESN